MATIGTMIRTATAALLAVLLTGCAGTAPATPPMPCETVDAAYAKGIVATATRAGAVKAEGFANVHMIAVAFTTPGGEQVGVWATNALSGSGSVFAVDGFARQFSDWPSSDVVDISASEPDVAEAIRGAKACAG